MTLPRLHSLKESGLTVTDDHYTALGPRRASAGSTRDSIPRGQGGAVSQDLRRRYGPDPLNCLILQPRQVAESRHSSARRSPHYRIEKLGGGGMGLCIRRKTLACIASSTDNMRVLLRPGYSPRLLLKLTNRAAQQRFCS